MPAKKTTKHENKDLPVSEMSLQQLRILLKSRGESGPKYLFSAVENKADLRDYRYVFWLDLMGARNLMKLSLPRAARAVMKIHAAALMTKQNHLKVEINPVMDGVYGVVSNRNLLEICLREMMTALALVFVNEQAPASRFMVHAGVAFGPIVPGRTLAEGAKILRESKEFLNGTAIGMAITHAYEAESCASPFGVYIHESARAFSPGDKGGYPYRTNLWQWFDDEEPLSWALRRTIQEHFIWLEKNPIAAQYEAGAMSRHKALATEYFELHALQNPTC